MIDRPRHDEQQVGQPVDVPDQKLMDGRLQRNHPPLGAAADRARKVERGASLGTAGQDEVRQRREGHLEPIDELLEAIDIGIPKRHLGDAWRDLIAWIGEPGAKRKQIALNLHERGGDVREQPAVRGRADRAPRPPHGQGREHQAEERVQLVHFAVRIDARVAFRDARAADERCVAGVTGACVDCHGVSDGMSII